MLEINLYKNYKLTLADAHKEYFVGSEVVVAEKVSTVKIKSGSSGLKKVFMTFFTATFGFAIIAVLVLFVINLFKKPVATVDWIPEEIPVPVEIEYDPDAKYIRIQVIEFADTAPTSASPAAARNTTPDIEVLPPLTEKKNSETDVVAPPVQQVKTETVRPPPPQKNRENTAAIHTEPSAPSLISLYSLLLDNATLSEYELLRNLAVTDGAVKVSADNRYTEIPVWTVYLPKNGSGVFIEGVEVAPDSSFADRAEAVSFAQKFESDTVIIKMDNKNYLSYNVKVCCVSLDDAKVFAQKSGITDKIFKLKKER